MGSSNGELQWAAAMGCREERQQDMSIPPRDYAAGSADGASPGTSAAELAPASLHTCSRGSISTGKQDCKLLLCVLRQSAAS